MRRSYKQQELRRKSWRGVWDQHSPSEERCQDGTELRNKSEREKKRAELAKPASTLKAAMHGNRPVIGCW